MTDLKVASKNAVVPKATMTNRRLTEIAIDFIQDVAWQTNRLVGIGEEHLNPLSGPRDLFTPAINRNWLWEQKVNLAIFGGIFLALDAVGSAVALTVPGVDYALALPIITAAQLPLLPLGVVFSKWRRGRARNFNAFLLWLKARYGVTLNAKQGLPGQLAANGWSWSAVEFKDDAGRWLKLVHHQGDSYSVELADSEGELPNVGVFAADKPSKAKSPKAPVVQLPRELKQLFYQIEEHLQVLSGRALSPESDHVVARAARDRDSVMMLVADLVRLQVNRFDAAQEAAIKRTFTTLLAELQEVTRKETTFALEALNIENTYVASREVKPGIRLQKEISR